MEVEVNVSLNGLEKALEELGPKLARTSLRKALKDAAKVMEDEIKMRVPVDTGTLRDSIGTVVTTSSKYDRGRAQIGPIWDKPTLKSGSNKDQSQDPAVYAYIIEFGRKGKNPNAFMRRSFDAKKQEVVDKFTAVLKDGLAEVTK